MSHELILANKRVRTVFIHSVSLLQHNFKCPMKSFIPPKIVYHVISSWSRCVSRLSVYMTKYFHLNTKSFIYGRLHFHRQEATVYASSNAVQETLGIIHHHLKRKRSYFYIRVIIREHCTFSSKPSACFGCSVYVQLPETYLIVSDNK